ncbi:MAG: 30S ribosomal protein S20 [Leptospiraceae bacterium]|nr:30S ribosomal protein S20 [Leptospiraceae bacterium]MCP5498353.1 30S ribosomal protein S20 [Leptospiraceae bacterium]
MANIRSSKKDIRRTAKRRLANMQKRSTIRTFAKNILKSIKEGKLEELPSLFNKYASSLDKAAKKKLIHKNNANRNKSRMAQKINQAIKEKQTAAA